MYTVPRYYPHSGFWSRFKKWVSQKCYRACSNEQSIRQHVKNKAIFFNKRPSTGCLDTHLAKSLPILITMRFLYVAGVKFKTSFCPKL